MLPWLLILVGNDVWVYNNDIIIMITTGMRNIGAVQQTIQQIKSIERRYDDDGSNMDMDEFNTHAPIHNTTKFGEAWSSKSIINPDSTT